jgi:hypothetical protein
VRRVGRGPQKFHRHAQAQPRQPRAHFQRRARSLRRQVPYLAHQSEDRPPLAEAPHRAQALAQRLLQRLRLLSPFAPHFRLESLVLRVHPNALTPEGINH